MDYSKYIKFYPDFPIKGVNFVDIIPFIQDKELFRSLCDDLTALCLTIRNTNLIVIAQREVLLVGHFSATGRSGCNFRHFVTACIIDHYR